MGLGLAWLAGPVVAAFVASHLLTPVFVPRYFIFLLPVLLALVAHGLLSLRRWGVLVALHALLLCVPMVDHHQRIQKAQWREAVAWMERHEVQADLLGNTGSVLPMFLYWTRPREWRASLVEAVPPRHLSPAEYAAGLTFRRALAVFFTDFGAWEDHRVELGTRFEEIDFVAFHGVRVGLYVHRSPGRAGSRSAIMSRIRWHSIRDSRPSSGSSGRGGSPRPWRGSRSS